MSWRDMHRHRRPEPVVSHQKSQFRVSRNPLVPPFSFAKPTFVIIALVLLGAYAIFRHLYPNFCSTPSLQTDKTPLLLDRHAEKAAERRPDEWKQLTTLVMVAGHAIYNGLRWDQKALSEERNWILEPFQHGQVSTFIEHIKRGIRLTANDSSALLLFSGGQTRDSAGPRSEGLTYWQVGESLNWLNTDVRNRTLAEEYARDSFENLLFSICRFHQVVGRYPRSIKVVGFEFKRARFTFMHRKAIRFPPHRFQYIGIDPPKVNGMHSVVAGERATAMGPFARDPYGCFTRVLRDKRLIRNPYIRYHPYPQGCPELASLFRHCRRTVFPGALPWDPAILKNAQSVPDEPKAGLGDADQV